MKNLVKFNLTILLLIVFVFSSKGQSSFGLRVGMISSELDYNIPVVTENRTGFDIGLVYKLAFNDIVALQPELHFIQLGTEFGTSDPETRIDYLQLPILLRINLIHINNGISIYPMAGPYAGLGIGGETTFGDIDFDKEYDRLDYGFQLGAGIDLSIGGMELFADARYLLGLADIQHDDLSTDIEIKNEGINIGLGIRF